VPGGRETNEVKKEENNSCIKEAER
jgi:hypothetical protein